MASVDRLIEIEKEIQELQSGLVYDFYYVQLLVDEKTILWEIFTPEEKEEYRGRSR